MALGAIAGTIPVFVVPHVFQRTPLAWLPYAHSGVDYCRAGFFVSEKLATRIMSLVLQALDRVTAADASVKHAELRRVQRAFTLRNATHFAPATAEGAATELSAHEWILREACAAARRLRAPRAAADTPHEAGSGARHWNSRPGNQSAAAPPSVRQAPIRLGPADVAKKLMSCVIDLRVQSRLE